MSPAQAHIANREASNWQLTIFTDTCRCLHAHRDCEQSEEAWHGSPCADEPRERQSQQPLFCRGSWREMFLQRPHLRFDGLYVSRNTYIRTGLTEWRIKNPVHLVTYFRYLYFIPDGRFTTRTSPEASLILPRPCCVSKTRRL